MNENINTRKNIMIILKKDFSITISLRSMFSRNDGVLSEENNSDYQHQTTKSEDDSRTLIEYFHAFFGKETF